MNSKVDNVTSFVLGVIATVLATCLYFSTIGHFAHFANLGVVCVW